MKKLIIAAFILCGSFSSSFAQSGNKIYIKFGTKSHPTCDDCCEGSSGVCIIIRANHVQSPNLTSNDKNTGVGEWELVSQGQLKISMLSNSAPFSKNEDPNTFYVTKDYSLSPEIAKLFGFGSLVIKKGKYNVDYSSNKEGVVIVNISGR